MLLDGSGHKALLSCAGLYPGSPPLGWGSGDSGGPADSTADFDCSGAIPLTTESEASQRGSAVPSLLAAGTIDFAAGFRVSGTVPPTAESEASHRVSVPAAERQSNASSLSSGHN